MYSRSARLYLAFSVISAGIAACGGGGGGGSATPAANVPPATGAATAAPTQPPVQSFALGSTAAQPQSIVAGPDGNLWFTEHKAIGRLTTSGVLTEFPDSGGVQPVDITVGPDKNLCDV